jgi:hypothetical protein
MKGISTACKVQAGQLRTWGERYFQLTPPNEGFEYFIVLWECGVGRWTVRFRGGKIEEMREDVIAGLTVILESESSLSIPLSRQLSSGSSTSSSQR